MGEQEKEGQWDEHENRKTGGRREREKGGRRGVREREQK